MSMFQLSGLASGIDSKSMVEQLMAVERQPILKLRTKQENLKSKNAAYQGVSKLMAGLATKTESLSKLSTVSAKTISSSDNQLVTATAAQTASLGTYKVTVKQLATATKVSSAASNGTPISGATLLTALKPANGNTLTAGTFTIGNAKISINRTDATLDHVMAAINSASDGNTTAGYDAAYVSFDIGSGTTGLSDTAASLDTTTGQLRLEGASGARISSGADTSNFLTQISGLSTATVSGADLIGQRMSTAQTAKKLSEGAAETNLANFGMLGTSGSFTINNATIAWTNDDTLAGIVKKINDSGAGVSAAFSPLDDQLILTNKATGNTAISISSDSGRFLEALGITAGTVQDLGKNSEMVIEGMNGGNPIARTTNAISDVVSGVTFNLVKVDLATPVTITVGETTSAASGAVSELIDSFNKVIGEIDTLVKKGGRLQYDPSLQQLRQSLMGIFTGSVDGLVGLPKSLIDLGVNSGSVGSAVDGAKTFSLNVAKFNAALAADPQRVLDILGKTSNGVAQGIVAKLDKYVDETIGSNGLFASKDSSTNAQLKIMDKTVEGMEARIAKKRESMEKRFLRMETTIAKMNSQRDRLMSQLSSLQSGMSLL